MSFASFGDAGKPAEAPGSLLAVVANSRRRSPARVGHYISRVVLVIAVVGCALLRSGARLQTPVTVLSEAARLSRLIDLHDLSHIVAVSAG